MHEGKNKKVVTAVILDLCVAHKSDPTMYIAIFTQSEEIHGKIPDMGLCL